MKRKQSSSDVYQDYISACTEGDVASLKNLLSSERDDVSMFEDSNGDTLLDLAIKHKQPEAAKILLAPKYGIAGDVRKHLKLAVKSGCRETVLLLLQSHSDIPAPAIDDALKCAVVDNLEAIVLDLLAVGSCTQLQNCFELSLAHGSPAMVQAFLDAGAAIKTPKVVGYPLQVAAWKGRDDIIDVLLDAGAAPQARGSTTILEDAATGGAVRYVRSIVDDRLYKRKLDAAMVNAARCGHGEIVTVLIDAGANVTGDSGAEALLSAIRAGHRPAAQLLIDAGAAVKDQQAMLLAAASGGEAFIDLLKAALAAGADPSYQNPSAIHGETPISAASDPAVIKLLLDAGADATIANARAAPLSRSVGRLQAESVRMLIDAKAPIDFPGYHTPLQIVVSNAPPEGDDIIRSTVAQMLLNAGATCNMNKSTRALDAAARTAYPDVAKVIATIVAHDASLVHAPDDDGVTALAKAVQCGCVAAAEALVAAGADVNKCDNKGVSPLMYVFHDHAAALGALASRVEYKPTASLIKLLLASGADVYAKDNTEKSVLVHLLAAWPRLGTRGTRMAARMVLEAGPELFSYSRDGMAALMPHVTAGTVPQEAVDVFLEVVKEDEEAKAV